MHTQATGFPRVQVRAYLAVVAVRSGDQRLHDCRLPRRQQRVEQRDQSGRVLHPNRLRQQPPSGRVADCRFDDDRERQGASETRDLPGCRRPVCGRRRNARIARAAVLRPLVQGGGNGGLARQRVKKEGLERVAPL
jgi:hypothetical protein